MNACNVVTVIEINGRYFYKFGAKGQVLTAWSVVAAKVFAQPSEAAKVLKQLQVKGKNCSLRTVLMEVL